MKLTKLIAIKKESDRFLARLNDAINRAKQDTTYMKWNGTTHVEIPKQTAEMHCINTKEAAAFKRAALDLKQELSNLNYY